MTRVHVAVVGRASTRASLAVLIARRGGDDAWIPIEVDGRTAETEADLLLPAPRSRPCEDTYLRLAIRGRESWQGERVYVWTGGARPRPLAAVETCFELDGARSLPSLALPPARAAGRRQRFERLILITRTASGLMAGTRDAPTLKLQLRDGETMSWSLSEAKSWGHLRRSESALFEFSPERSLCRADIVGVELAIGGADQWSPERLDLFGAAEGIVHPLVHIDDWRGSALSEDSGEGRPGLQLPLVDLPLRAALLERTEAPLSITKIYAAYELEPPGSGSGLGVALSGGGSRALVAGMGQLCALEHTGILDRVRALSTVSGGSWLAGPWMFLSADEAEEAQPAFLGNYSSPGELEITDELPAACVASHVTRRFRPLDILWSMICVSLEGDGPNFAWQDTVAGQFLEPYGLAERRPFTWNDQVARVIEARNPDVELDLVRVTRSERPFHVCNTGLIGYVREGEEIHQRWVCPVQSTPFHTGALGSPPLVGAAGQTVGLGGLESFAFAGTPQALNLDSKLATVVSQRPWSLTDAVGTSSAFVAAALANAWKWLLDSTDVVSMIREQDRREESDERAHERLRAHVRERARADGREGVIDTVEELLEDLLELVRRVLERFGIDGLRTAELLLPSYEYFPITSNAPTQAQRGLFVDGGDYDNTGVSALLVYEDIDRIVAFVNTGEQLAEVEHGIEGEAGTEVRVSSDIAALFGYMPYSKRHGYRTYASAGHLPVTTNMLAKTQVFPAEDFAATIRGLASASRGGSEGALGHEPAVFTQELVTIANDYAGVSAGRRVEVVWCLLAPVSSWADALSSSGQQALAKLPARSNFPNISVLRTQLPADEIQLLANLSAWCVVEALLPQL